MKAVAPRGVYEVIYQIDENRVGGSRTFPFDFSYHAKTLNKGVHVLQAVLTDNDGRTEESALEVEVK